MTRSCWSVPWHLQRLQHPVLQTVEGCDSGSPQWLGPYPEHGVPQRWTEPFSWVDADISEVPGPDPWLTSAGRAGCDQWWVRTKSVPQGTCRISHVPTRWQCLLIWLYLCSDDVSTWDALQIIFLYLWPIIAQIGVILLTVEAQTPYWHRCEGSTFTGCNSQNLLPLSSLFFYACDQIQIEKEERGNSFSRPLTPLTLLCSTYSDMTHVLQRLAEIPWRRSRGGQETKPTVERASSTWDTLGWSTLGPLLCMSASSLLTNSRRSTGYFVRAGGGGVGAQAIQDFNYLAECQKFAGIPYSTVTASK